jgi:prevent-host-death family protein
MEVNLYEAKTKLSQLVERAMVGEEIIIAKAGKPMVKLVRLDAEPKRVLGSAAGTIEYCEGWDAPMGDDELDSFLGR